MMRPSFRQLDLSFQKRSGMASRGGTNGRIVRGRMSWWGAALLLALACAGCSVLSLARGLSAERMEVASRQDVIDRYLSGRSLSWIEGVWVWQDNTYELAILPNRTGLYPDYQYVAVVTDAIPFGWQKPGRIKMFIQSTARRHVYTGRIWLRDSSEAGVRLRIQNRNELRLDVGDEKLSLYRVYPVETGPPDEDDPGVASGSGFLVGDGLVVTNHHVVDDGVDFWVRMPGSGLAAATLVSSDWNNDLAVLRLKSPPTWAREACLPLLEGHAPQRGSRVYAFGFPLPDELSDQLTVTDGLVNDTTGFEGIPGAFQMSTQVQAGNSGGPVLDERGRVVGVATAGLVEYLRPDMTTRKAENVNFSVKAAYVRQLLEVVGTPACATRPAERPLPADELVRRAGNAVVQVRVF